MIMKDTQQFLISPSPIAKSVLLRTLEQGVAGLITGMANIIQRTEDSHRDKIHSSLTAVHCFNNSYVGKQPVAWKEYCAESRKAWIGVLATTT